MKPCAEMDNNSLLQKLHKIHKYSFWTSCRFT